MNLYIFRHGKTAFTGNNPYQDKVYGDQVEVAEILPEAIPVIVKLGKFMKGIKTDFNVSSPFLRCRQTVDIVEKHSGKKFVFDPLLHDIDHRTETVEMVARRITEFYQRLMTKDYKAVSICSHGYPIAMLKSLALEGKVNMSKLMDYPTPGVLLSIVEGKASYKDFNELGSTLEKLEATG